jgi:multidrug resistance efflux pump
MIPTSDNNKDDNEENPTINENDIDKIWKGVAEINELRKQKMVDDKELDNAKAQLAKEKENMASMLQKIEAADAKAKAADAKAAESAIEQGRLLGEKLLGEKLKNAQFEKNRKNQP